MLRVVVKDGDAAAGATYGEEENHRVDRVECTKEKKAPLHPAPNKKPAMKKRDRPSGGGRGRCVRFRQVEVRLYDPVLGDNPSVSSGPPIGIDWSYMKFNRLALQLAYQRSNRGKSSSSGGGVRPSTTTSRGCLVSAISSVNLLEAEVRVDADEPSNSSPRIDRSPSWPPRKCTCSLAKYRRRSDGDFGSSTSDERLPCGDCEMLSEIVIPIDEYERQRESRGPRRSEMELRVPREAREERLRENGYGSPQIASAVREAIRIKNSRRRSYHNYGGSVMELEEMAERASRTIRRAFVVSKERKEKMRSSYLYKEWSKNGVKAAQCP